ncbi:MAG: hypothetical protein BGO26_04320 [Actinobacteria bacterium 69-20]|nr:MAG: hypothetical protein BGO26_04320 [Actinobacteria bacterium 69-20]
MRARLTAATVVVLTVGMTVASVLLVWQVHNSLIAGLDTAVTQQVQSVAAQAQNGELQAHMPNLEDGGPAVQVVSADGQVIAASNGLRQRGRMFTLAGAEGEAVTATTRATGLGPDAKTWYRVAVLTVTTKQGPVTVYAALQTDSVTDSTAELSAALAVGVPVVVVALAVVAWLLVGRALQPVEALRRQAAAIPASDLRRRLEVPAAQDELGRLAATLNDLLSRIQASTGRQRQFIADAAHELRSPIASLHAQLEILGRRADRAGDARGAEWAAGMIADTRRLTRLVNDLLALARLDANPKIHRQTIDLDDLVLDEVRRAQGRGVAIDAGAVSAGRVLGDPAGLARVVRNLLDNAVRHAAGRVVVGLRGDGRSVTLTVSDDGPGIAPADRERIFERFTRLDDARSRDAGGAGLGLAIVRDVVRGHGGSVRVGDNKPGARFTVTLPAAD